jgi:UDP:flavonoid glycosyltransferase YjiC (YdhE family)
VARGQYLRILSDLFADQAAHAMVPDLLRLCASWRPDVLIRNDYEFGSCIAAGRIGLPLATIGMALRMPPALWRAVLARPLGYLRQRWGLAGAPTPDWTAGALCLSVVPPSYQTDDVPAATPTVAVHLPPFDADTDQTEPVTWPGMPARPRIYVTLGTVFNRDPQTLRLVIDALVDVPAAIVLTLGSGAARASVYVENLPPHIRVARYVPQSALLADGCDLVITVGGFSTVMGALRHGVPVLVLPTGADHYANAIRCQELGLGRALDRHALDPADAVKPSTLAPLTVESLRRTIADLLGDHATKARVAAMRTEMVSLPGEAYALKALIALGERTTAGHGHGLR